jgi:hypothetical protein
MAEEIRYELNGRRLIFHKTPFEIRPDTSEDGFY